MKHKATTRRTPTSGQIDTALHDILADLVMNVRQGCPVAHRIFLDRTIYLIRELFGSTEEDDDA